eukprot:SAG31_NODE_3022_length_4780_cov_10.130955_3_plen_61_part_00
MYNYMYIIYSFRLVYYNENDYKSYKYLQIWPKYLVPDSQVPKVTFDSIFYEDRNLQAVQI